jgi:uncharacterized membrane protein
VDLDPDALEGVVRMNDASAAPRPEHVRQVELVISPLLRVGVVVSLVTVVAGLVISFIHHPDYRSSYALLGELTTPGRVVPHSIHDVIRGVSEFRGEAVVALGLLLLIATPVLRVAVSIVVFLLERDWIFVLVTSFVLGMLILSFFLGRIEG